MITHVVIFRTKCDEHKKLLLEQAKKKLGIIETMQSFVCGTPIISDRPVVDDTFAVGLVVRFKNDADMAVYATHPSHLEFNEFLAEYKIKVQVYDIAD
jgi:hypothetical protein